MKNVHLLPTDKPSRLYLFEERLILGDLVTVVFKKSGAVNQYIYITDDSEIKMGDWVYSVRGFVGKFGFFENSYQNECKKIILTTDQDLIKDGVQAIDDDFLKWFVKNPSCEQVEVDYGFFTPSGRKVDPMGILQNHSKCVWKYKIIIPKKNFYCGDKFDYDEQCLEQCETCVDKKGVDYGYLPKEESKLIECYFTPKKNTSSATICDNCGEEKFLHNIGEGVKISNYINIPK